MDGDANHDEPVHGAPPGADAAADGDDASAGHSAGASASADDPVGPAVAQFQKAALDAVAAARSMLDAAEAVVRDPAAVEAVLGSVTELARQAATTVTGFAAGAARAARPDGERSGDDGDDGSFHTIVVD